MTRLLIYILTLAAVFQPDKERRAVAGVFCCATLCHELFLSDIDGFLYYGSAALFDLAIISILSKMHIISGIALKLQRICVVSIIVNFFGWACWYNYFSPVVYNLSFILIYLWVLALLLQRNTHFDLGKTSMGGMCSGFRGNFTSGNYNAH